MRAVFHWIVVAAFIAVGLWALAIYGEIFRAHMPALIVLWLFLPLVAFWLTTKRVYSVCSAQVLRNVRGVLLGGAILISVGSFAHYDRIRDYIGHHFIDGYSVTYFVDYGDEGQPFRAATYFTSHWYLSFALWMFEWGFLAACVVIPLLTWHAASQAIKRRTSESA